VPVDADTLYKWRNTMISLEQKLNELVEKTIENNLWRQRKCFNLIPSENTPSLLVKLCEISDPSGRYAEHKKALKKEVESLTGTGALKGDQVYYYQGADFIYEMEQWLKKEFASFVGGTDVETRPVSGQMANEIVFKGLVKFLAAKPEGFPELGATGRLQCVMNNDLNYGGHLSAQPYGALFNFTEGRMVNFPADAENPYKMDAERMIALVDENRPSLIVFGKSMFLHPEPVGRLRTFLDAETGYRPLVMYDAAHVLGILGSTFQDPLGEGALIVTGSTHKTFFGPQRGIIAAKIPEGSPLRKLWSEIVARTFPGSTSNHHLGTQLAMLAATIEMNEFKDAYQSQVLSNARAFAKFCAGHGIPVEGGADEGYTHTHQVLIRVDSFGDAKEIASRLEANNIITNYQALPGDATFYHPSGIRMGVQEMTRFGMKEQDFDTLARFIANIVLEKKNVAGEVEEFRKGFTTMEYCLDFDQTRRVASRLFQSVFPGQDHFLKFVESLKDCQ
jgi:glycine/serine hydroxymethyltransferase